MSKTECFFCHRTPKETGKQEKMFYMKTVVKACSLCRAIFSNGGDIRAIKKKRYYRKMKIGDFEFRVFYNFGHGFIVSYSDGGLENFAYLSKRFKFRHLYRKDNSYPVSVDIVSKLRKLNISVIVIHEVGSKLYFFYTSDYAEGMIIQHKDYDRQYSVPLEKAFKVVRLERGGERKNEDK